MEQNSRRFGAGLVDGGVDQGPDSRKRGQGRARARGGGPSASVLGLGGVGGRGTFRNVVFLSFHVVFNAYKNKKNGVF